MAMVSVVQTRNVNVSRDTRGEPVIKRFVQSVALDVANAIQRLLCVSVRLHTGAWHAKSKPVPFPSEEIKHALAMAGVTTMVFAHVTRASEARIVLKPYAQMSAVAVGNVIPKQENVLVLLNLKVKIALLQSVQTSAVAMERVTRPLAFVDARQVTHL